MTIAYLIKRNLPFRINKLVTLRRASLGDFWKNLGVRLGGRVRGFRAPVPSHGTGCSADAFDEAVSLSKCSIEAGLPSSRLGLGYGSGCESLINSQVYSSQVVFSRSTYLQVSYVAKSDS